MDGLVNISISDVVFGEATAEQQQLVWELRGEVWAAPLSLDDYVKREQHLAAHELNRDRRCRYWVLHLKEDSRQLVASCESSRRAVLISDSQGGADHEGNGCVVSNIHTSPAYRHQGMASFLLCRVRERIDLDSDCSVLYSRWGRRYYASLGWSAFSSHQATLSLLGPRTIPSAHCLPDTEPRASLSTPRRLPQTRPLQTPDLPGLCELDRLHFTKCFAALPADKKKMSIAFIPSHAQISWHLARAEFDAAKLFPPSPSPSPPSSPTTNTTTTPATTTTTTTLTKGAITLNNKSWTYWSHDWRASRLRILRIVTLGDQDGTTTGEQLGRDVAALLAAALDEARAWGLDRVVVINPDEVVERACMVAASARSGGCCEERRVHVVFQEVEVGVPGLRWRGGRDVRGVVWEENFGCCWC